MPFGLSNSPATFQRLMEYAMEELYMAECFVFIDDINVPAKNFKEGLLRLEKVFEKVRKHKLKLNAGKCALFQTQLAYCGHIISERGVETDSSKITKVSEWPVPQNVKEIQGFLGLAGYYRRFIKNYSTISKPLYELTGGPSRGKKSRKCTVSEWKWETAHQEAFDNLKEKLTSPCILGYARYDLPFVLHTDASQHGLGAVLSQIQDGEERVISYASRRISKSEKNYPVHKLEFLALKWAITDKFSDYLYGAEHRFTAFTDNNPLTYVLSSAKLDATGHRWIAALSTYNFDIKYRSGKKNANADSLSRLPGSSQQQDAYQTVDRETVGAICKSTEHVPFAETLCMSVNVIPPIDHKDIYVPQVRRLQREDPVIGKIIRMVNQGEQPKLQTFIPGTEAHQMAQEFQKFRIRRGLMYRVVKEDKEEVWQVVLPKCLRTMVLESLHDEAGHQGKERTLSLLRDRFYWPWMARDTEFKVKYCERCIRRKSPVNQRAPLVNIETVQPLELVCMDYLTLETSKGGYSQVLVITDHFTRFAQAIPTKDQTAKTTAEVFFNSYIVHYGVPLKIHSDQGACFDGKIIHELCKLTGMTKSRTTAYHPAGNGMCERLIRTLLNMLGTLNPAQKRDWKTYVGPMVHAYNATGHKSTNQSPFYLMFGRQARLPIDLLFDVESDRKTSYGTYMNKLRDRLKNAYEIATTSASKSREKQTENYDVRARAAVIQVVDRVLVKILAFDGKHKLVNKWEEIAYNVISQPNPEIPAPRLRNNKPPKTEKLLINCSQFESQIDTDDTDDDDDDDIVVVTTEDVTSDCNQIEDNSEKGREEVMQDNQDNQHLEDDVEEESRDHIEQKAEDDVMSDNEDTQQLENDVNEQSGDSIEQESADEGQMSNNDDPQDPVNEVSIDTSEDEPDTNDASRRSTRNRTMPVKYQSDEYIMSQVKALHNVPQQQVCNTDPEWKNRATFLASLAEKNIFSGLPTHVSRAILQLVPDV